MIEVIIVGLVGAFAFIYYENHRTEAFRRYLKSKVHVQDGKWLDWNASYENFNNSWPWNWDFQSMKVDHESKR